MRTLILYCSKTGNTKKYAEDIARAVHADVLPAKKFKRKLIDQYDTFVFGGWVMANTIKGLNEFLSFYEEMKDKDILVFSVGMSLVTQQSRTDMISANILDLYHVRYYQLRGSFDFNKLGFIHKILMNHTFRLAAQQDMPGVPQSALATLKDHPIEYYDQAGIDRIVSVLHRLDSIVEA